ncbi:MAG: DUF1553 domain-containing protein [Candidatus Hydrogenedentes bacterium]|nr:DUF1553 domain-containing protein [Candidatus Hydrogenedentota bacterium]
MSGRFEGRIEVNGPGKSIHTCALQVAAVVCAAFSAFAEGPAEPVLSAAEITAFEQHIRPLLSKSCYACHGADKQDGDLRLDQRPADMSRETVAGVFLNKPEMQHPHVEVSPEDLDRVLNWIAEGAPWPKDVPQNLVRPSMARLIETSRETHWAFKPVANPVAPEVTDDGWGQSPIDAFLFGAMREAGLTPSPTAAKRTLLRRVHYDLTGLPPSYDEAVRFEGDASPDAYEKVVDKLLASPQYGERWGRHWLDIARYSDTRASGFEDSRYFPFSYTYRDYVIRAFNEDLPYNEFLLHQLAADQLDLGEDKRPLAALGFLSLGRPGKNHDVIDDQIDVVSRGLMALTVNCARCHDHKFDPIPTADYYSLYGIFRSTQAPDDLPIIEQPNTGSIEYQEYAQELARLESERDKFLDEQREELSRHNREHATAYLQAAIDALDKDDTQIAVDAKAKSLRTAVLIRWRDYAAKAFEEGPPVQLDALSDGGEALVQRALDAENSPARILPSELESLLERETRVQLRQRGLAIENHKSTHPGRPDHAMAVENTPVAFDPFVFVRGDPENKGANVPRQFLAVLSTDGQTPYSGHGRLELARAIASRDNPLTARVLVNRVWMHLFGNPLAATPSDFGIQGEKPAHPELLDHLAWTFMEDGWSVKRLIRRIVLSSAYQQRSDEVHDGMAADPANSLIWRQNRRRLDFEAMRDTILKSARNLDLAGGGPPPDITRMPFANLRTVYGEVDRENLPAMYRIFDFAPPSSHSPNRFQTTVPQQGLFMMNSAFVAEQARLIASNVDASGKEPDGRIADMYRAVLTRDPLPIELALANDFVDGQDTAAPSTPYYEPSEWKYGYGALDTATGKVTSFTEFSHWVNETYQGADKLPTPESGSARLDRLGGHPGGPDVVVIRRWVSPASATLSCVGELHHYSPDGDGVAGYVVSSREGILWKGEIQDRMIITVFDGAKIEPGDTIDLIIGCKADDRGDQFRWHPRLYVKSPNAGKLLKQDWLSRFDFRGPPPETPVPLTPWEQYAQVLLMSNEFMFVD